VSSGESLDRLLVLLHEAGIEFIVVGGMAGVLHGAPIVTRDLDIVHRKTPENIAKLLALLLSLDAYCRSDLANRRLPPTSGALSGHGHLNLATKFGPLDVLCELAEGEDYDALLPDTELSTEGAIELRLVGLPRLIAVKARTGRAKDRMTIPILIATLEEREKRKP
jgi:hypothetical protein